MMPMVFFDGLLEPHPASKPTTPTANAHIVTARIVMSFPHSARSPPRIPLLQLIQNHRENDHQALDDDLPELRDAEEDQAVGQHSNDEGADNRTSYAAAAAHQRGAAQNHRCDGVQLERLARGGVRGS